MVVGRVVGPISYSVHNHNPSWGGSCTATPPPARQYNCRTNRMSYFYRNKALCDTISEIRDSVDQLNGRRIVNLENRDSDDQLKNDSRRTPRFWKSATLLTNSHRRLLTNVARLPM